MAITTMEELLKKYSSNVKGFSKGQKIEATLIEVGKKSAIFNVGGKGEALLKDEFFQEARDYVKSLKPGDKVTALVMEAENRDGNVIISLRHAASDSLWEKFETLKKEKSIIQVNIKNVNPSGVSVDYEGISSFIPVKEIGKETLKKIESVKDSLKVRVVEVDKMKKKIGFSEKAVSEEKEIQELAQTLKDLDNNKVYEGKVTTVTNFGIFVEIKAGKGTVEGLVHVSELSWEKVNKPSDAFEVGQKVKVKVLGVKDSKLSLSIKEAKEDPWKEVAKKIKVDDKVKGKVVRNSDFGIFVQLEPGIEGLIHITKIPPATKFSVGDEVTVTIEEIDTKNKKIALGLVLTTIPLGYK